MLLDPERSLIEDCRDPNSDRFEAAFESLYQRYKEHVYNIAYRITGNAADAMDITQEAFGLLLRKLSSFEFNARFSSWLYRIVVNLSIDLRRRRKRHDEEEGAALDSVGGGEIPDQSSVPPIEALASMELQEAVHTAIQALSPKLRAIVVLRYMQGLSYEELTETLQINMGTVKSRLARAHLALESIFGTSLTRFGVPVPGVRRVGQEGVA